MSQMSTSLPLQLARKRSLQSKTVPRQRGHGQLMAGGRVDETCTTHGADTDFLRHRGSPTAEEHAHVHTTRKKRARFADRATAPWTRRADRRVSAARERARSARNS